jgi:pimeloyl-ACP methyl ester carboxylesterase
MYPLHTYEGNPTHTDAPILNMALANGFPPATYQPFLRPLQAQYRAVCLPPRALWLPPREPRETRHWLDATDDLLGGMVHHRLGPLVAVGHSMGGICSILAAVQQPQHFRALVLLDPTFLSRPLLWLTRVARWFGQDGRGHPLAQGALRRKATFSDSAAALAYFRSKRFFSNWDDEALRLYAEHGTRPADDGQGVTLVWPPVWEARYFQTVYVKMWRALPQLSRLSLPILFVRGSTSDVLKDRPWAALRRLVPNADYREIMGHGHLFPHSAPQQTAAVVREWLAERGV